MQHAAVNKNQVHDGWYMVFVTALLQIYWVAGAALGGLVADYLPFSLKGAEFAMTGLFLVIFLEQWLKEPSHESSLIGLLVTLLCLGVFGEKIFLFPAMVIILLILTVRRKQIQRKFQPPHANNCHKLKELK